MALLTVTERRNNIIEILNKSGSVNVSDLSKRFGVSGVVIRTDLTELENQGMLTRVHGGAITSYKSYYDMSLIQRANTHAEEKQQIAKELAKLIKDNDTIMMNAGTTPIFVAREISSKKVTIVTNSIALALEGAKNPNFKILLIGGDVDSSYQFTYGTAALCELDRYSADLLILSVDGIDANKGFSTFYHHEAEICRRMIKNSKKKIVVADFSKLDRVAFAEVDKISAVDTIITNEKNVMKATLKNLRSKGVEVITAT